MNLFLLQGPIKAVSALGTKIVLNKQSDLILHGAEIVAPTGIVEADIDGLVSHFTQIEQTISDSGSQLNSGIDNEASIRLEADQSLAADLATEKGRIDVILDGSTVDLDQFKEVVDFVQSIDLENDESLLNAIVNINQNIDNVIGDFQSADNDILDQLSTLTVYTEDQVNIISSGLEQEIIDRDDAVNGVQNDLNNYKDYTDTTIINLQNNISMGDESLATSLSSEESSRISGDESLATLLTNSLDQNYSQLSSDIAAEVSRATTAEESLANTIANVISNVDPTALDSLSEIVDAFVSADDDLNGAITALANNLAFEISSEISNRMEGDVIEAEKRAKADQKLNDQLNYEISSEISNRMEADVIEAEKRAKADQKLADNLAFEISSEISNRMEADASLEVALSTEVSYLIANTDLGSIDSFAEIISDLSTEVERAESVEVSLAVAAENFVYNMTPSFKEVTGVIDGLNKVFTSPVIDTTSIVFFNGLLQREGRDYQILTTSSGFAFSFNNAPQIGDAVDVYGCPIGVSF